MNDYEKIREQLRYLKKFAEESGTTVILPAVQRPNPSKGRPYTVINHDIVIVDYPDYIR